MSYYARDLRNRPLPKTANLCKAEINKHKQKIHLHRLKAVGFVALSVVCGAVALAALALVVCGIFSAPGMNALMAALSISLGGMIIAWILSVFVAIAAGVGSAIIACGTCDEINYIDGRTRRINQLEVKIQNLS